MTEPGMVFRQKPGHYWFVISDPAQAPDTLACVNMTSFRNRPGEDLSCELFPGDHDVVAHRSWISYKRSCVYSSRQLRYFLDRGIVEDIPPPCSARLLKKLRAGALASLDTPRSILDILEQQGFFE